MAELADAGGLNPPGSRGPCGFESHFGYEKVQVSEVWHLVNRSVGIGRAEIDSLFDLYGGSSFEHLVDLVERTSDQFVCDVGVEVSGKHDRRVVENLHQHPLVDAE
jgi:hypothetical protein